MKRNNLGIYVHIPFCESKCLYCDFNSSCESEEVIKNYIRALLKEIELYGNKYSEYIVDTIFIGGGTPSSINYKYILMILERIKKSFCLDKDAEISIEGNPNSITEENTREYVKAGINRISIGAQSFDESELKELGRIHSSEDISLAVEFCRNSGLKNINIDLMMGIPKQSFESLEYSLQRAVSLNPTHISFYSLILEEGTPLYEMESGGVDLKLPGEDDERLMYKYLLKFLRERNYHQYEISNFSLEGYECRHNIKYWKSQDYLGLGLSAHGRVKDIRYSNTSDINEYIKSMDKNIFPRDKEECLSTTDRINEYIFMGIRLNNGIDLVAISEEFSIDFLREYENEIEKNLNLNYLEFTDGYLRLTDLGRDFSNLVELDFYRLET